MPAKRTEIGLEEAYGDEALTISPEKVCFVIVKAREFDVKDSNSELESGSNPADDNMLEVLEDSADDPVYEELTSFIGDLTEDEQIDLVALTWLGRDDYTLGDWPRLRSEALHAHRSPKQSTADYLLALRYSVTILQRVFPSLESHVKNSKAAGSELGLR
jgi:hypothetical protein